MENFGQTFARQNLRTYYLLAPLAYIFRILPGGEKIFVAVFSLLSILDNKLLARFQQLRKYVWYGAVTVQNGRK